MFQISVSSTYGLADFRENLLRLYTKVTARLLLPIVVSAVARQIFRRAAQHMLTNFKTYRAVPPSNSASNAGRKQGPARGAAHDGQPDRQ